MSDLEVTFKTRLRSLIKINNALSLLSRKYNLHLLEHGLKSLMLTPRYRFRRLRRM